MMARPSEDVMAVVTTQLDESISEVEASKAKLLERIAVLQEQVAQQECVIAQRHQLRESLHNGLDALLRPAMDAYIANTRYGQCSGEGPATDSSAKTAASAAGRSSGGRAHNGGTMRTQVADVVASIPARLWTARMVKEQLPHLTIEAIRNNLQRLFKQGKLERPEKGQYRHARATSRGDADKQAGGAALTQPSTSLAETEVADDSAPTRTEIAAQPAPAPIEADREAQAREQILSALGERTGRSWRLEQLAEFVGLNVTIVHAVLQRLLRSGEVVTAIDGGYLVPQEHVTDEQWAAVN